VTKVDDDALGAKERRARSPSSGDRAKAAEGESGFRRAIGPRRYQRQPAAVEWSSMDLRIRNLEQLDVRAVQLPHGTEVVTRVDRIVGERRVSPRSCALSLEIGRSARE
jgi:hypothetical protein